jgi:transcriptional antiterminator NusG
MNETVNIVATDTPARWFVLHCVTGTEGKVKQQIEKRRQDEGLEERVLSVEVPKEKVFEIFEGKKRSKEKTYLPGYILVQLRMDQKVREFIMQTPGVLNFVGDKNKPIPLRNDEVKRFLGKLETEGDQESSSTQYRVGLAVKVIDGPFSNFMGTVQEVNIEKMRLKVIVSIFGRKTPVELDFAQVEEIK